jgi:predicted dehydrogenase
VEFDNGAIGALVTGTQAPRFEHRVEVNTTTGVTLSLTDLADLSIAGAPAGHGTTVRGETRRRRPSPMNVGYDRTGFEGELSAFLTSVSTGRAFTPAFDDLVPTYRLIDQIDPRRSAR